MSSLVQKLKNLKSQNISDYSWLYRWQYSLVVPRLYFIALGFAVCYSVICAKVLYLSTHKSKEYSVSKEHRASKRHDIIDCNGKILATSIPIKSLYVHPKLVNDKNELLNKLARVLPALNKEKLRKDLESNKHFIWLQRNVTPVLEQKINNLGIPGLEFIDEQKRVYPYDRILAHLIGYVDIDSQGIAGVERFFNNNLITKNLPATEQPQNLKLSIDVDLQHILAEELQNAIDEFKAIGGTGIIADPNNGEILALVSKPDFDPHHASQLQGDAIFNRASLGIYELGSVFKPLTMAMAIDSQAVTLNDSYHLKDFKVANLTVKDFHKMKEGRYSVPQIFIKSSNIGIAQIALDIGKKPFYQYLKNLGLLDPLSIELPEKSAPIYLPQEKCNDLTLVTMSYGYQLAISPLHLVQAIIPTVNGGTFYPLTLLKTDKDKLAGKPVLKSTTSQEINKLLRLTVMQGTGKKAEVSGYLVGGKSGTANKVKNGKYANNARRSSFIGVFPAVNPKYVIYIMLDEPKGKASTFGFATGGYTAAPAVGKVISRIVGIHGVTQYDENDPQIQKILHIDHKLHNDT